jgi:hypothetical protein
MNRAAVVFMVVLACASGLPVLLGRVLAHRGGRRAHLLALLGVIAISGAIAVYMFGTRAGGVPDSRALTGASIALLFLGLAPLTFYIELGYRTRSRIVVALCWALSLAPLAVYAFFVWLEIYGYVDCTAAEYANGCGALIGG